MIILHDIQTKLAEMKELIEQRAFHPYLLKNIKTPMIDEDKILLLITVLDQLNLSDIEKNTYITATLLIQLALDTHDLVRANSIEEDLKSQQLTVLAGDYYSGLYYKYLASVKNVSLIRELSDAIKEINEQKILLHDQNQFHDIDQILNCLERIEGALFDKISKYFNVSIWSDFTFKFLLAKRLLREREQIITTGTSIGYDAIKKLNLKDTDDNSLFKEEKNILHVFDQAIKRTINLMNSGVKNYPLIQELFDHRIQSIVDEYQNIVKTYVEEG